MDWLPGEQITTDANNSELVRDPAAGQTQAAVGNGSSARPAKPPVQYWSQTISLSGASEQPTRSYAILRACGAQLDASADQIRSARSPASSNKLNLVRWAFLAPDIQQAILEGRLSFATSPRAADIKIPLLWSDQRSLFGVAGPKRAGI